MKREHEIRPVRHEGGGIVWADEAQAELAGDARAHMHRTTSRRVDPVNATNGAGVVLEFGPNLIQESR